MINGRPYSIKWEKENIPAILEAWYPGEEGGNAVARILFGEAVPSGSYSFRTSECWSWYQYFIITNHQVEAYIISQALQQKPGHDYVFSSTDPLFPFGYGLSYTQFEYSDLRILQKEMEGTDTIKLSVKIKNTGAVTGKEVVQVYIHDKVSSATTPGKSAERI